MKPGSKAFIIDAQGRQKIMPFLKSVSDSLIWIPKRDDRQYTIGDVIIVSSFRVNTEIKTEKVNPFGNLFLEEWSNRKKKIHGWMYNLDKCHVLIYNFLNSDECYGFPFQKTKEWFMKNKERFVLKEQNKYSQHNDSWGRLVPIDVLIQEVGMLHFPLYNPAWQEKWNQLIEGIENASS